MQCDEFESRLQSVLDERALPEGDPALLAHAAFCDRCELLMQTQHQLFLSLRTRNEGAPGKVFSARVVDEAVAQRVTFRQSPWTLIPAGLIALAASWLVFFVWPQFPSQNQQTLVPALVSAEVHRPAPGVLKVGPPERPLVAIRPDDEASERYHWLVQEILVRFSETEFEELQSVDEIAGGFRPIATTLNVAFDALRRTFPGSGPSEEST